MQPPVTFYSKTPDGNRITNDLNGHDRCTRPMSVVIEDGGRVAPVAALSSSMRSSKGRSAPAPPSASDLTPPPDYRTADRTARIAIGGSGRVTQNAAATLERLANAHRDSPTGSPSSLRACCDDETAEHSFYLPSPPPTSATATLALSTISTVATAAAGVTAPPLSTLDSRRPSSIGRDGRTTTIGVSSATTTTSSDDSQSCIMKLPFNIPNHIIFKVC